MKVAEICICRDIFKIFIRVANYNFHQKFFRLQHKNTEESLALFLHFCFNMNGNDELMALVHKMVHSMVQEVSLRKLDKPCEVQCFA